MILDWLTYHGEYLLFAVILVGIAVLLIRQQMLNNAPEYVASATVDSRRMMLAGTTASGHPGGTIWCPSG